MHSRILALAAATALLSVVSAGAVRAADPPPPVAAYGQLPQVENVAMAPGGQEQAGRLRHGGRRRAAGKSW